MKKDRMRKEKTLERKRTKKKAYGKRLFSITAGILLLVLTACTAKKPDGMVQEGQEKKETGKDASAENGSREGIAEKTDPEGQTEGSGIQAGAEAFEGQIKDQSFPVELDGWGKVMFASFEPLDYPSENPDYGATMSGDVRFVLLSEDKAVYTFPGEWGDNILPGGMHFLKVVSAAFKDYDEDGRTDILLLLEYEDSGDSPVRRVRVYTQEEGEKEFRIDSRLSEYLGSYSENMSKVEEGIANYRLSYSVSTECSAWEVERFAKNVKKMILAGDYEGLAAECAYPVMVDGIAYETKEALLAANLLQNLPQSFTDAIRGETAEQMFHNGQGIMMGNGEVWIAEVLNEDFSSRGLKIISISLGSADSGTAETGTGETGFADGPVMSEEEILLLLNERDSYYTQSSYYGEVISYWEEVRGVTDISSHMEYLFESDRKYLTKDEMEDEPPEIIHLAKNEIYARHGYIFRDKDLYNYFMYYTWYMPATMPEDFNEEVFNEYEKTNLKLLDSLDTVVTMPAVN